MTCRTKNNFAMRTTSAPPYRPFWVYRFFVLIQRLPIPGWLLALLIIVIVGVADHLVAWRQGDLPVGQINSYLSTVGVYIVLMPTVWAYLTQRANRALLEFFEGSGKSAAQVQAVSSDFNSLPDWEMILLLVFGFLAGYFMYNKMTVPMIPISAQVLPSLQLLSFITTNGLMYPSIAKALRQIVLVKRFYGERNVDIFNPRPIYALSRYMSLISIMILFIVYGLQAVAFPSLLFTPVGLVLQVLTVGAAFAIFFFPLTDVNRTMRRAKENLLDELNKDLKNVQQRVHHSVQSQKLAKISELRTAVAALKDEIEVLHKIRTWPWQTETLRNLLTPLLIPIVVYLIQRFLGGMLGL